MPYLTVAQTIKLVLLTLYMLGVGFICKGPGGANAPGAPFREKNVKTIRYKMNMRDGWYINKAGERITQAMHRKKNMWDDKNDKNKAIFNNAEDGLIFKGVEEILQESEECAKLVACDGRPMPYRCNKARRLQFKCTSNKLCTPGQKCCMVNTLKCRPDFCDQRCKLEEVCNSHGVQFHLLPICHPELNPIEGKELQCCKYILTPHSYKLQLYHLFRFVELYQTVR
jgi:hypothetical protein